jgi:hypothetical protein
MENMKAGADPWGADAGSEGLSNVPVAASYG